MMITMLTGKVIHLNHESTPYTVLTEKDLENGYRVVLENLLNGDLTISYLTTQPGSSILTICHEDECSVLECPYLPNTNDTHHPQMVLPDSASIIDQENIIRLDN